ncbi:hypothetical protein F383_10623 [Gossypium arboreum]|uniref:Uncharacterized protein n=1 Tax=Gossypium arboreum TaxID=29729 RepID=A0A0B0PIA2_GOSAR|nr:hypothetical protein F383_10623 [Gossypium arboreum]
MPVYFGRGRN